MIELDTKPENVLERTLWIGALAAAANRERAHFDGELERLVIEMLRRWKPDARA